MKNSISFEQAKEKESVEQVWEAWLKKTEIKNPIIFFVKWQTGDISLTVETSEVKWKHQPSAFSMYGA